MAKQIIIAEDEVLIGLMLKKKMEQQGYSVSAIVTTGQEAIDTTMALGPDIVFMDISLFGDINGVEAAQKIREVSEVPIIFFTGNPLDQKLLARANKVNPVAILNKMDELSDVLDAVAKACDMRTGKE